MKAFKKTILILIMATGIFSGSQASSYLSGSFEFRKKTGQSNDTSEVNRYTRLSFQYGSKSGNPELMKANIDSAESICRREKIDFPSLLHLARAEYFLVSNDFNNAAQEATIALRKSTSNDETNVLIRTMNFFGKYYSRTQFYNESIEYFKNAINLARKNKIKGIIPGNYNEISMVYASLDKLKERRDALQMSIDAAFSESDTLHIEYGYYLLGSTFLRDSSNDKDRDFNRGDSLLRRCLEISLAGRDSNFIALSLVNLGWNLYLEKRYDEAIASYNKSFSYTIPPGRHGKYANSPNAYGNSANAYGNLGTIYRDIGDTEKSIKNYKRSIEQAKKINDVSTLWWVYRDMSELYLRNRDTSNAFQSYVQFNKYHEDYMLKTNALGMSNAKIRYEADAHNKELEVLSLRIRNQKLLLYGYTGLLVLSLAILILLLSRSKINARRRISEMNHKISEITQANLRQQMNPHFIFNTLNSIQYYMYQHDKLATNNYLTKFSSLMRKVLENSQHTSIPLRDELDALNLYLELEKIRFKDKFDYEIIIDEEIDTILYKVPTMLIQPYVENSICHGLMPGENKGLVKISLELKKDYISCIIEDNGIGREAAQEKKMNKEKAHNSLGTQIVSSRLDLVNSLYGTSLKTIYTDLKNENGDPEGTRVELHIPILT